MELFSLFSACLVFVICSAVGIAILLRKIPGVAPRNGLGVILLGCLFLTPLVMILPAFRPTMKNISGVYSGRLDGPQNVLTLHPNGTFVQIVDDGMGGNITNRGTWKLDSMQDGSLDFDHIVLGVVVSGPTPVPQVSSFAGAYVRLIGGAIYFDDDTDEHLSRVR